MLTTWSRTVAAAALGLAVAACAGSSSHPGSTTATTSKALAATDGPGGKQVVTIKAMNNFRFDPPTITAHTGKLQVTLVDSGSYPHNLAVNGMHFTSDTISGSPGQNTTTFTLTFAHPGSYPFVCTFHSSAGMRGTFVIH